MFVEWMRVYMNASDFAQIPPASTASSQCVITGLDMFLIAYCKTSYISRYKPCDGCHQKNRLRLGR